MVQLSCDATADFLYPILSSKNTDTISTQSWVRKFTAISVPIRA